MQKFRNSFVLTILLALIKSQVNGDVSELIQKYYNCKNKYSENPLSRIDDSFYKQLGIDKMNFDEGMSFIRKIYTDTENCETKFCICVNEYIDQNEKYNIFFRNESIFAGVKSIISAFNNKYNNKNYLKSLKISQTNVKDGNKYPTIVRFLIKYDYTSEKNRFYNNLPDCDLGASNPDVKILDNFNNIKIFFCF